MAQDADVDVRVQENFNLRNHLESQNFTEYSKIESAVTNGELTINDILDCNEQELKETLSDYNVKAVQRNRFIKAIKLLPNSKMNQKAQEKLNVVVLTTDEQQVIDKCDKISQFIVQQIKANEETKQTNRAALQHAIGRVMFIVCFAYFLSFAGQ